jgi:hypothetical protein
MGSHKAAKRCDRGFAAPFLVTKAHIATCPLAIYWTVSLRPSENSGGKEFLDRML